jgi:3-carboxy-cis,cis-muconate cycloisomerase
MGHEHERAAGAWQVEWTAIPDCFCFASNAVDRVVAMLRTLEVDDGRMAQNLGSDGGVSMAEALSMRLAEKLGKKDAHALVEGLSHRVTSEGITLREAARGDTRVAAVVSADEIDAALDPANYSGSTEIFVQRALDRYRRSRPKQ